MTTEAIEFEGQTYRVLRDINDGEGARRTLIVINAPESTASLVQQLIVLRARNRDLVSEVTRLAGECARATEKAERLEAKP